MQIEIDLQTVRLAPAKEKVFKEILVELIGRDSFLKERYDAFEWTYICIRCESREIKVYTNGGFIPVVIDLKEFLKKYSKLLFGSMLKPSDSFELEGHFRSTVPPTTQD